MCPPFLQTSTLFSARRFLLQFLNKCLNKNSPSAALFVVWSLYDDPHHPTHETTFPQDFSTFYSALSPLDSFLQQSPAFCSTPYLPISPSESSTLLQSLQLQRSKILRQSGSNDDRVLNIRYALCDMDRDSVPSTKCGESSVFSLQLSGKDSLVAG